MIIKLIIIERFSCSRKQGLGAANNLGTGLNTCALLKIENWPHYYFLFYFKFCVCVMGLGWEVQN